MLGLGLGLHGVEKASGEYSGGAPSLIVPTADRASLEVYLSPEEQDLSDGATITTIIDQTGKLTITPTNLVLNIAADGKKEFDFSNATARIDLGNPPAIDFSTTDDFTVIFKIGEVLGAAGRTWFSKGDRVLGLSQWSLFYSGVSSAFSFMGGQSPPGGYENPFGNTQPGDVIAFTFNGTGAVGSVYWNGTFSNSRVTSLNINRPSNWFIGVEQNGASFQAVLSGTLRSYMMFSELLTPQEIIDITNEINAQ